MAAAPQPRVQPAPSFGRVLLKLSGEALMGSLDYGTDPERVRAESAEDELHADEPKDQHDSLTGYLVSDVPEEPAHLSFGERM